MRRRASLDLKGSQSELLEAAASASEASHRVSDASKDLRNASIMYAVLRQDLQGTQGASSHV